MLETEKLKSKSRLAYLKIGDTVIKEISIEKARGIAFEFSIMLKDGIYTLGFEPDRYSLIKRGKFKGRPTIWNLTYIKSPIGE